MTRIFGTDGVRGLANGQLTAELALDLSVAAARVLADRGEFEGSLRSGGKPLAVVGRDTRISGQFLEHAVVAGLASAGVDAVRLRVLPTPAVAYMTQALGADLGVVISASHNPMPDNGIKFLARGAQGGRAGHRRGTVGTVKDDAQAAERSRGRDEVLDVLLDRGGVRRHAADVGAPRRVPLGAHDGLDLTLHGVVELDPAPGEELDAVVGHRVVRGADDDAEVGAERPGEVGDPGGRHHPQAQDVTSRGGEAGDDRVLEELPRDAGVATHDRQRARSAEVPSIDEDPGCCNGKVQGERSGENTVRLAPDPVRAEKACHAWCGGDQRLLN